MWKRKCELRKNISVIMEICPGTNKESLQLESAKNNIVLIELLFSGRHGKHWWSFAYNPSSPSAFNIKVLSRLNASRQHSIVFLVRLQLP